MDEISEWGTFELDFGTTPDEALGLLLFETNGVLSHQTTCAIKTPGCDPYCGGVLGASLSATQFVLRLTPSAAGALRLDGGIMIDFEPDEEGYPFLEYSLKRLFGERLTVRAR